MQDEFLEPIRKPGVNKYSFLVIHQVPHHSNMKGRKKDLRDDHFWENIFLSATEEAFPLLCKTTLLLYGAQVRAPWIEPQNPHRELIPWNNGFSS